MCRLNLRGKKLESIKSETLKYKDELPSLVGKIDQAKSDGDASISQKIRLEEDLKNYPEITNLLRNHYKRVLKAMRKYSMDRPWLERGEVLALQFNSIDLRTGLISLPVGTEEGIKGGCYLRCRDKEMNCAKLESNG